jgi:hypothetical protein
MRQSQQVLEWQAQARQEGRQEGERERSRALVLRALELRYRTPVPADLAAAVAALNDLGELSRWFDATLTNDTLDAFRAEVGRTTPP